MIFSEKAVQIAGRDASRAATEPTRNDATAEKWREESCGRKVAGGKLREESYGRKEATERSEPDSEVAEATEVTIGARPFDVAWLCSGKTFTYYITMTAADFQGLFNLSQGFRRNGKEQFIVFAGSEGQRSSLEKGREAHSTSAERLEALSM